MESPDPRRAAAATALADAEAARAALAGGVQLPPGFSLAIRAAVALQIATAAAAVAGRGLWPAVAGVALFGVVALVELRRFRDRNGVRIDGLASRVVLGTGLLASLAYAAGLAVAAWGALTGAWWVTALASLAGGALYATEGRRWLREHRAAPHVRRGGELGALPALALALVAAAGLVVLVLGA